MTIFPPPPPNKKKARRKEALKVFKCSLFHQDDWMNYTACVEPHIRIAVCSKCGTSHLLEKGFTTAVETDIKIDKLIKEALG